MKENRSLPETLNPIVRITDTGHIELDGTDKKILNLLMEDADSTMFQLSKAIGISNVAIHQRIKKLRSSGVIEKSIAVVNTKALNRNTIAFIGVFLDNPAQYKTVVQAIKEVPEILESYFTTGNYTLLLKVLCQDNEHLMKILNTQIQSIPGVVRTETFISLEQNIQRQMKI